MYRLSLTRFHDAGFGYRPGSAHEGRCLGLIKKIWDGGALLRFFPDATGYGCDDRGTTPDSRVCVWVCTDDDRS